MTTEKPQFMVYTNEQLSNDDYHDKDSWCAEYVSGSSLADIYATCPAAWKFSVREPSAALEFGTQSHTIMLEIERFNATYRRGILAQEVKDVFTSQTALASHLKNVCGLTGTSNKTYPDLIRMMVANDLDLNVLWLMEMIHESQAFADKVEIVKAEDYDKCIAMRATLLNIPEYAQILESKTAQREISIFGVIFGVKVKVRIDHVDKLYDVVINDVHYDEVVVITDYKTTQSVKPSEFGKHAYNFGYYLKMALQRDLFKAAFGETCPIIVQLLAQEKKEPFLPLAFTMTPPQLALGSKQYTSVIHQYNTCQARNVWPSYENNSPRVELPVPEFVKFQNKDIFAESTN